MHYHPVHAKLISICFSLKVNPHLFSPPMLPYSIHRMLISCMHWLLSDPPWIYSSLLTLCGVSESLHEPKDSYCKWLSSVCVWMWEVENMFRTFRPVCTMQQSKQRTDEEARRPNTSPHSRHRERPFPTADLLMFSRRSTRPLKHTHTHLYLKEHNWHIFTYQLKVYREIFWSFKNDILIIWGPYDVCCFFYMYKLTYLIVKKMHRGYHKR